MTCFLRYLGRRKVENVPEDDSYRQDLERTVAIAVGLFNFKCLFFEYVFLQIMGYLLSEKVAIHDEQVYSENASSFGSELTLTRLFEGNINESLRQARPG